MQTALAAALSASSRRADRRNPLGDGDWRAARAAIGAFYAGARFAPVWVDERRPDRRPGARRSRSSSAPPTTASTCRAFALPRAIGAGLAPDALAEAETAIAAAVVVYAEQATGSRVAPARVSPLISAAPEPRRSRRSARRDRGGARSGPRLADFNPPQKGYRDLREELKRLESLAAPSASAHRRRSRPPIRDRRRQDGALAPAKPSRPAAASVPPPPALRSRSARLARQRAAILANMEMWRWEPRDMGERRIEVNIPDFSVAVMDGDAVVHRRASSSASPKRRRRSSPT